MASLERLKERIEKLRARRAVRKHSPIIEYRDRADVPRLIAERAASGRIAPGASVLVIPETADSIEQWTANVAAGRYRETDPPAEK